MAHVASSSKAYSLPRPCSPVPRSQRAWTAWKPNSNGSSDRAKEVLAQREGDDARTMIESLVAMVKAQHALLERQKALATETVELAKKITESRRGGDGAAGHAGRAIRAIRAGRPCPKSLRRGEVKARRRIPLPCQGNLDYHGPASARAAQGYQMMVGVILKPILMTLTLFGAYLISVWVVRLVTMLFGPAFQSSFSNASVSLLAMVVGQLRFSPCRIRCCASSASG